MGSQQQATGSPVADILDRHPFDLAQYEDVYKQIHAHPEPSLHEANTASTVAKHAALKSYKVHGSIGGHGVAAVLENGSGPVVLLRADMDALPVEEETGLNYASKATFTDPDDGSTTGPNEERGSGAKAMVDDGLYKKVPVPDVVLAQHVMPSKTGTLTVKKGTMIAAADSFRITLFRRGGHGSMPQLCIDPVVLAANVVIRLQGIVAREIDPAEAAVLTIGSLQAGHTENVIADKAVLKVDIRIQHAQTRERILKAMKRIVEKECEASDCEKPPTFEQTRRFPLTVNDDTIISKLGDTFAGVFGQAFDPNPSIANASEDVSDLATAMIDRIVCGSSTVSTLRSGTRRRKLDGSLRIFP
ncbi:hypothetical protein LTR78_004743 [Recurvomyces mirabilis]|uniref:Peptidase M20 dimerisation domain-containing protein n=1 Tax=Recurvomyces mirabilis TaxID=574656 RepID=A0AAE0WP26_9PEZI|nr:hypothetical protein LTR78_004743 [Recurvomyces mirabilis]KAK5157914.1 hypothetical protein LTS14_003837 [Recurvomyces mirabilis]